MDRLNQGLVSVGSRLGAAIADGYLLFGLSFVARPLWDYSLWDVIANSATRDGLCSRGSLFFYAGAVTRIWPYSGQWWISMIVLSAVYFIGCHHWLGATMGKRAFGLQVVSVDGSRPTLLQASLRYLGYWVSSWIWGLGYLPILWGGRPLHDRIADTTVVRMRQSTQVLAHGESFDGVAT